MRPSLGRNPRAGVRPIRVAAAVVGVRAAELTQFMLYSPQGVLVAADRLVVEVTLEGAPALLLQQRPVAVFGDRAFHPA